MIGWLASLFSVIGLVMAGRKKAGGWLMCMLAEFMWCAYADSIRSWSLLAMSLLFFCVYSRNLWKWLHADA